MKIIAIVLLAILSIKSCNIDSIGKGERGNGKAVSVEPEIGEFSKIETNVSADVIYEQKDSANPFCRVEIDENLSELVSVTEVGGKLKISTKEHIRPTVFKVYINSGKLEEVNLAGSGNVWLKNDVKSDELKIKLRGSGDIKADNIECSVLKTELKGSGNIEIETTSNNQLIADVMGSGDILLKDGKTNRGEIKVTGSGDLNISGVNAKNMKCTLKGSGDIFVNVADTLAVQLRGSGDVVYAGKPLHVDKSIKGSGSVKAKK